MAQDISIPVFFSKYNAEFNDIIDDISVDAKDAVGGQARESALSELINSVSANGYQIVVSGASHFANKQSKLPIIQGELAPVRNVKNSDNLADINNKLPLIIVTAHINTFGLINVCATKDGYELEHVNFNVLFTIFLGSTQQCRLGSVPDTD